MEDGRREKVNILQRYHKAVAQGRENINARKSLHRCSNIKKQFQIMLRFLTDSSRLCRLEMKVAQKRKEREEEIKQGNHKIRVSDRDKIPTILAEGEEKEIKIKIEIRAMKNTIKSFGCRKEQQKKSGSTRR